MSEQSHKVNVNLNSGEKVVHVNLQQGMDFIKILSLELNSEDTYQLHTSNYGVVVGRVLANGSYGIPNVKVSAFIPLDNADKEDNIISTEYPYSTMQVRNMKGKKYNILPNSTFGGYDGNHKVIGSFPNKREVLDNNGQIEVFDKYWKYTTVTNECGDYMLFGVPTGVTQIHIDCDISDIGILSQRPYDLMAKGYDASLFASMTEFKTDNIENSPQIFTQNKTVTVFPFWGDEDENRIGITRCDIQLEYDFTPCCIFMGSTITDSPDGYIGTEGMPKGSTGRFNALRTCTGNIEIIRKTLNGEIEKITENVDNIIDGNGVWCYQIPMNLDRISMDEEGNLVQENDPNKGIPTRARVRMRISLNNSGGGSTAKYLVPNNPAIKDVQAGNRKPQLDVTSKDWSNFYEFGKNTPDCCFRDLYWNKVYTIKAYYPRFQYEATQTNQEKVQDFFDYSQMPYAYSNPTSCIHSICPGNHTNAFPYNTLYLGAETRKDNAIREWFSAHFTNESTSDFVAKGIHFCFENDWINGCLYFPNVLIQNDEVKSDYFGRNATYYNLYLTGRHELCYYENSGYTTHIDYVSKFAKNGASKNENNIGASKVSRFSQIPLRIGIIKRNDKSQTYYYSCGGKQSIYTSGEGSYTEFIRLYATDIVNLGNLVDVLDNLPHLYEELPSTTATFPPLTPPNNLVESGMNSFGSRKQVEVVEGRHDDDAVDIYGNWWQTDGQYWENRKFGTGGDMAYTWKNSYINGTSYVKALYEECENSSDFCRSQGAPYYLNYKSTRGEDVGFDIFVRITERYAVFFGLRGSASADYCHFMTPTFVNTSRICELDVGNDHLVYGKGGAKHPVNGMIDSLDIISHKNRSAFASMNCDINKYTIDPKTRRKCFVPTPLYVSDFDGRLYRYKYCRDIRNVDEDCDESYILFRYGDKGSGPVKYPKADFRDDFEETDWKLNDDMILTENSFYFYFGLNNGFSALDKLYGKYYSPVKS